jgi:hypothetical protein
LWLMKPHSAAKTMTLEMTVYTDTLVAPRSAE